MPASVLQVNILVETKLNVTCNLQGSEANISGDFTQALQTLSRLRQANGNGPAPTARGLSLAAVELESRRCSSNWASSSAPGATNEDSNGMTGSQGLSSAILEHFKGFGHLSSCASDLK